MSITAIKLTKQNSQSRSMDLSYVARADHFNPVVDDLISIDARVTAIEEGSTYQGAIDCSTEPDYPAATENWYWVVSVAGKIGGASGIEVEVGDTITCIETNDGGDHATVGDKFVILQKNMTSCTLTKLRAGTDDLSFVSAKTLNDAGFVFTTAYALYIQNPSAGNVTTALLALLPNGGQKGLTINHSNSTENDANTISVSTNVSSAALIKALDVNFTSGTASATNMVEAARFTLTSRVQMGAWANAICGKLDFYDNGYITGLAGAICAELDIPSAGVSGGAGTYTCFQAELIMAGVSNSAPVSMIRMGVSGDQAADYDTNGFIFDIAGVTMASGKVFQANTAAAASHALKIRINGTPYYIMLTNTGA